MILFLISFVFIGLVMAAMAVGVLAGRSPIKGSCGGMAALGIDTACDICGGNPQLCEEESSKAKSALESAQFYEAAK